MISLEKFRNKRQKDLVPLDPAIQHDQESEGREKYLTAVLRKVRQQPANWILREHLTFHSYHQKIGDRLPIIKVDNPHTRVWNKEFANQENVGIFLQLLGGVYFSQDFAKLVSTFDYNYLIFMSVLTINYAQDNPDHIDSRISAKANELLRFMADVGDLPVKGFFSPTQTKTLKTYKNWNSKLHFKAEGKTDIANLVLVLPEGEGDRIISQIDQMVYRLPVDLENYGLAEKFSVPYQKHVRNALIGGRVDSDPSVSSYPDLRGNAQYITQEQVKQELEKQYSSITLQIKQLVSQKLGTKDWSSQEITIVPRGVAEREFFLKFGLIEPGSVSANFPFLKEDDFLAQDVFKKLLHSISVSTWRENKQDILLFFNLIKRSQAKLEINAQRKIVYEGRPILQTKTELAQLSERLKAYISLKQEGLKKYNPRHSWLLRGKRGAVYLPNKPVLGTLTLAASLLLVAPLESREPMFHWGDELRKAVDNLGKELGEALTFGEGIDPLFSGELWNSAELERNYNATQLPYHPENSQLAEEAKRDQPKTYLKVEYDHGVETKSTTNTSTEAVYAFDRKNPFAVTWSQEKITTVFPERVLVEDPGFPDGSASTYKLFETVTPYDLFLSQFNDWTFSNAHIRDAFFTNGGREQKYLIDTDNIPRGGLNLTIDHEPQENVYLRVLFSRKKKNEPASNSTPELFTTDAGSLILHIPYYEPVIGQERNALLQVYVMNTAILFGPAKDTPNTNNPRITFGGGEVFYSPTPVDVPKQKMMQYLNLGNSNLFHSHFRSYSQPRFGELNAADENGYYLPNEMLQFVQNYGFDLGDILLKSHQIDASEPNGETAEYQRKKLLYPNLYIEVRKRMRELGFKYSTDVSVNSFLNQNDVRTYFAVGSNVGLDCDGLSFVENLVARLAVKYGEDAGYEYKHPEMFPEDFFGQQYYKGKILFAETDSNRDLYLSGTVNHAVLPNYKSYSRGGAYFDEATSDFSVSAETTGEDIEKLKAKFTELGMAIPKDAAFYQEMVNYLALAIAGLGTLAIAKGAIGKAKQGLREKNTISRRAYEQARRLERSLILRIIPAFKELSPAELAKVPEVLSFMRGLITDESNNGNKIYQDSRLYDYLTSFEVSEEFTNTTQLEAVTQVQYIFSQLRELRKNNELRKKVKRHIERALTSEILQEEQVNVLRALYSFVA